MTAAPKLEGIDGQNDLVRLSGEISALMLRYSNAIGACKSVPTLSVLSLITILPRVMIWVLCFEFCFLLVPIDLFLFLARHLFGRPQLVLGSGVYGYLISPLRSAWNGEIPAFAIFRVRYLSRLLLFYRAQYKINALHSVFNRWQLDLLFADQPNNTALEKAEKFQKSFDLFQKITADSYQIGIIAIGGPFVALLTLAIQQGFLPLARFLWTYFGGPAIAISNAQIGTLAEFFAIFAVVVMWFLVSTWMDMRSLLVGLAVPEIEHHAYMLAGIRVGHQVPFDILFYIGLIGFCIWGFWGSTLEELLTAPSGVFIGRRNRIESIEVEIILVGLLCIGLIALARRLWLSRKIVRTADFD